MKQSAPMWWARWGEDGGQLFHDASEDRTSAAAEVRMTQRTAAFRLVIWQGVQLHRRYSSTMPPRACSLYTAPLPRRP
jgi:hypothetical protein